MFLLSAFEIKSFPVRDPIYDFIEIPEVFKPVLEHKLVQRLRWINQLPLEQLVYPSAQHSRFEHSFGVMYLAMLGANSLIENSPKELLIAFKKDDDFKKIRSESKRNKNFILAAGLAGLLHDVGHAPFSHTLEDACKYSNIKYKYDHEEIGYLLSEIILNDAFLSKEIFSLKTLSALNKKLKTLHKDLTPVSKLIRELIDGPIDVDKGDYVIRDSYHCGTSYGKYDIQRLWRNIVINPDDYTIAVSPKGALEAWTLRFQRYRMFKNVYKHHTRNITDSMLIDIIVSSIKQEKGKSKSRLELIPIWNEANEIKKEENLSKFVFWTDHGILKKIADLKDAASIRIEAFLKRDIFKRGTIINLEKYPEALAAATSKEEKNLFKLQNEIMSLKNNLTKGKELYFDFLIEKDVVPPVFEKAVQQDIMVKTGTKKFIPLAGYLNFSTNDLNKQLKNVKNKEEIILPSADYKLHIYIKESNKGQSKFIEQEIKKLLTNFNSAG